MMRGAALVAALVVAAAAIAWAGAADDDPRRETSARELARGLRAEWGGQITPRTLRPMVHPSVRSAGEVIYVQLSGITRTALGAMVVLRQHLDRRTGPRRSVTRVFDVRLKRGSGPWSLDGIFAVGGSRAPRPGDLSAAAKRVIGHERIFRPDSARWDIYRGGIDDRLLSAVADAADRRSISITTLRAGHPPYVWATRRPSAYGRGLAADIYAVGGQLVLRQRRSGTAAHALAREFVAAGAAQVGSPWVFPPGRRRSFTDPVHQDHVHVQARVSGA